MKCLIPILCNGKASVSTWNCTNDSNLGGSASASRRRQDGSHGKNNRASTRKTASWSSSSGAYAPVPTFAKVSNFSIQKSCSDLESSQSGDTVSTLSETVAIQRSLVEKKEEIDRARMKYLNLAAQVECKGKNLLALESQFKDMLKILEEKDKEVTQLLRETESTDTESTDTTKEHSQLGVEDPREVDSDSEASTGQNKRQDDIEQEQDMKAELDALHREVEFHQEEMAKVLEEQAFEREQKEIELRKLKTELVSLKFMALEKQVSNQKLASEESIRVEKSTDASERDERRRTELKEVKMDLNCVLQGVENGNGDDEDRESDFDDRGEEVRKVVPESNEPRPKEKETGKDVHEMVADWERVRKESREKVYKRESLMAAKYSKAKSVSSLKKHSGTSSSRRYKPYPSRSLKEIMEPIPELPETGHRQGSVFDRLYKTDTESVTARKRSSETKVSAKGSDEEPIKQPSKEPIERPTKGPVKGPTSPLISSGKSFKSSLRASPDTVLDLPTFKLST